MTKDSAEEKIVQIGRKKIALDQALIESMGAEVDASVDFESILKHGAEALFNDDDENDIHYDSASVDKLLDRAKVENIDTDEEKSAESQFSFARVWANDKGVVTEDVGDTDSEPSAPNASVWDKILKQREADAVLKATRNMQTFGRGKRTRQVSSRYSCFTAMLLTPKQNVDYIKSNEEFDDVLGSSPQKKPNKKRQSGSASDLDFAAAGDSELQEDSDVGGPVDLRELEEAEKDSSRGILTSSDISIAACTLPNIAS
jgi:chromodomain-helicase-DNA-binding protein 4